MKVNCSSYPPDHVEIHLVWADSREELDNSTFIADKRLNNRSVLCTAFLKSRFGELRCADPRQLAVHFQFMINSFSLCVHMCVCVCSRAHVCL